MGFLEGAGSIAHWNRSERAPPAEIPKTQACDDHSASWLGGSATRCALLEVTAALVRRPWEAPGLEMTLRDEPLPG